MTSRDIAQLRLLRQRIAGAKFRHPDEVVRWMGALQAQDYAQALWAIGLRTQSATLADVEAAIASRKIVRTWPMRGTLHFVPAENAKWMLDLLASRKLTVESARLKQLEIDEHTIARSGQVFQQALQGGKRLTRSAMLQLLEDAGISPAGQRGYHILGRLARTGLLCLGPMQGKEQTFVLLDEWVPAPRQLSREEALAELAACYFASHGPATLDDFVGWTGLTRADARAGLEAAKSCLVAEKRDAKEYWLAADPPAIATHDAASVYLLPAFDEYLLGYKDRGDVLAPEHANKIVPGGNGMFYPMMVVGGQIVGTWKRTVKKRALTIALTPFVPLDVPEERMAAATKHFGDFLGLPVTPA